MSQIQFRVALDDTSSEKYETTIDAYKVIKKLRTSKSFPFCLKLTEIHDSSSNFIKIIKDENETLHAITISALEALKLQKDQDLTLLVVDDQSEILELVQEGFQEAGIKVISATGIKEVISNIGKHYYDIILTDIYLSKDYSGLDLLNTINKKHFGVIIAMSGVDGAEEEALARGFDQFIKKPIDIFDLVHVCIQKLAANENFISVTKT